VRPALIEMRTIHKRDGQVLPNCDVSALVIWWALIAAGARANRFSPAVIQQRRSERPQSVSLRMGPGLIKPHKMRPFCTAAWILLSSGRGKF
jgi:hypothetical protein